jgi:hypothetical protein
MDGRVISRVRDLMGVADGAADEDTRRTAVQEAMALLVAETRSSYSRFFSMSFHFHPANDNSADANDLDIC